MTARPAGPIVLVHRDVTCDDCHEVAEITTDGISAYTESHGYEYVGGSREGTMVSTLCPVLVDRRDGEPCYGTLLLDLGEESAWMPASSDLLARLALAGRLDV